MSATTPVIEWVERNPDKYAVIAVGVPDDIVAIETRRIMTGGSYQEAIDEYGNAYGWITVRPAHVEQITDYYTGAARYSIRGRDANGDTSIFTNPTDELPAATAPSRPTPISPEGAQTVQAGSVAFRWQHNPVDGSAQTKAQVEVTNRDDETITQTVTVTGSTTTAYVTLGTTGVYRWSVRTAGASGEYSDWSEVSWLFTVAAPPMVAITETTPKTVTSLPTTLAFSAQKGGAIVTDLSYEMTYKNNSTDVTIVDTIEHNDSGVTATSVSLLKGAGVDDDSQVSVTIIATDANGFTDSATGIINVNYDALPDIPTISVEQSEEYAQVNVYITAPSASHASTAGYAAVSDVTNVRCSGRELSVYSKTSNSDGTTTYIVRDRLAPLDTMIAYTAVVVGANGSQRAISQTAVIDSHSNIYVHADSTDMVPAYMSKNLVISRNQSIESTSTPVNGKRYPVSMYGEHMAMSGSVNGVIDLEDITKSIDAVMVQLGGWQAKFSLAHDCIMRLPKTGERMRARISNGSIEISSDTYNHATVSFDWEVVDGAVE